MSGWDCFDDSDNDDDQSSGEASAASPSTRIQAACQQAFVEAVKFCGASSREEEFGEFGPLLVDSTPRVALNAYPESRGATPALAGLEDRLRAANYRVTAGSSAPCDCCVDFSSEVSAAATPRGRYPGLRPGGLLVLLLAGGDGDSCTAAEVVDDKRWAVESAQTVPLVCGEKGQLLLVTRRSVLLNERGVAWKPATKKLLAEERANAERIAICRTCASIERGSFSARDVARAAAVLAEHGVCVVPQLFDPESCRAWGRVAVHDLRDAIRRLAATEGRLDVDEGDRSPAAERAQPLAAAAVSGVEEKSMAALADAVLGDEGLRRNYHELAMREAYRVDLRKAPRMARHDTRQANDATARGKAQQQQQQQQQQPPQQAGAAAATAAAAGLDAGAAERTRPLNPRHAGLGAVLQATMNPQPPPADCPVPSRGTPRPHSGGNFGRWNFAEGENAGPTAAVPLTVGPVGCVVSLPGAGDQAVHADVYHLFEDAHLPPHYVNLFFPALDGLAHVHDQGEEGGGATAGQRTAHPPGTRPPAGSAIGQTAFFVGSHCMATCARLTADQSGGRGGGDPDGGGEEGDDQGKHGNGDAALDRIKEAGRAERLRRLVRPHLEAGDLVLFDCRVLHFGLANRAAKTQEWRPLLYANVTQRWFEDKKNWEKVPLFSAEDVAAIEADDEQ